MDGEDRENDKKFFLVPQAGLRKQEVSLDVIKSTFIAGGKTVKEISEEFHLPESQIQRIVDDHKLPELRKAYLVEGLKNIKNVQLQQSQKLLDIENNFKKLRLIQLEKQLQDFVIYYERHGHFYKLHPATGDILRNIDGIPMQLTIPNVSKEIQQLKESVNMSEGLSQILNRIDEIINTPRKAENVYSDAVDVDFTEIFRNGDE